MNRLRYWNERAETLSRDELAAVQLKGLQWTVKHVWANNEFYRRKLAEVSVEPGDIRELEDVRELPFLTKDDFRDQYPLNMLCMPRGSIREMHMSSGSTGTPVVMAYTEAISQYGSRDVVDVLDEVRSSVRDTLGAVPHPITALLGYPALVWGVFMRARRRQGWWVCAFGVAATAPAPTATTACAR